MVLEDIQKFLENKFGENWKIIISIIGVLSISLYTLIVTIVIVI